MDRQLRALAEPRRRAILALVRDRELAAGAIAAHFEVTRPAVSQHLSVLKDAALLTERRDGTRRLYRANPQALAELKRFIDDYWTSGLRTLKAEAEAEAEANAEADAEAGESVERRGRVARGDGSGR